MQDGLQHLFSKIRPFDGSQADYRQMVDFFKMCWSEHGDSTKELKIEDGIYSSFERHRFFFYIEETAIAFGELSRSTWSKGAGNYSVTLVVDPKWRRQGLGGAVYDYLMGLKTSEAVRAIEVGTTTKEAEAEGFALRRGFKLGTREIVSRLDLQKFRHSAEMMIDRESDEVEFMAWPELLQLGYTERDIHAVFSAVDADVPWHEEHVPEDFEKWSIRSKLEDHHLHEHNYFAIHQNKLIGLTTLISRKGIENAYFTGLTGVLRDYRRKGIARRLKKASLNSVIKLKPEIQFIWTENEEDNPMYMLNEQLGFERQYDLLFYQKKN